MVIKLVKEVMKIKPTRDSETPSRTNLSDSVSSVANLSLEETLPEVTTSGYSGP